MYHPVLVLTFKETCFEFSISYENLSCAIFLAQNAIAKWFCAFACILEKMKMKVKGFHILPEQFQLTLLRFGVKKNNIILTTSVKIFHS